MIEPRQVYLLTILHRHGEHHSVYASHRAALLALYAYVQTWWQEAFADPDRSLVTRLPPSPDISRRWRTSVTTSLHCRCST